MPEYIDRAYIMGKITASETQAQLKQMDGTEAYNQMLSIVNSAPASDVAPVRRGRWDRTDDMAFCIGDFECSECEYLECDVDTSVLYPGLNCLYFCPYCGAKMDGGGNG